MDTATFLPILPEILLLVLALLVLALDAGLPKEQHRNLGWVTAAGAGMIMLVSLTGAPDEKATLIWGEMLRHDWLAFIFKLLFTFGAGITALLAMDYKGLAERGEFYALLLISTLGMNLMVSSADLVMLYLAIETTSIPLYILAGFLLNDDRSTEAGFKYLLFGAMTSSVMLYGFSLLYGFSGTTSLYRIADGLSQNAVLTTPLLGSLLLILVGFGFKISAVPFHFWAPDVYQGAPTPVAGFLSTASKAAGFMVLMRFLITVAPQQIFPQPSVYASSVLMALSITTMTLGNLVALAQTNVKRLLAYSSIAHAGYALIGIVVGSELGLTSTIFYMVAYLVTNLAAFGVVTAYGQVVGSDEYTAYYGMSRRSPYLALAMLVAFLSLAGMPPLGGFIAKVFVFAAAVQSTNLIWLAVIGVLNSIVGLYYYLTLLKYVYLYRSDNDEQPASVSTPNKLALVVLTIGILVIGILFGPWFTWASMAARAIMPLF